ncbi:MAG: SET domain-containing protein-lysine N-methyltransferase [Ignavibacteriales bacterium]|nr:MAG: SET domain-containing protein-lysine N-methyltransferase [Ignavibacteriales bacterium]
MSIHSTLETNIYVKESSIHGTGLFTSVFIPEGSKIMFITGEVISEDECVRREEEGNVYIFWNEINYIDTSGTDKIKFINHDCDHNCDVTDGSEDHLVLIASKNISAGEELTIDYGYEEIYDYCNCNLCSAQVA